MFREANLDGFGGIGWMLWLVRKLEWNTGHERRQQLGGLSDVERFNNCSVCITPEPPHPSLATICNFNLLGLLWDVGDWPSCSLLYSNYCAEEMLP